MLLKNGSTGNYVMYLQYGLHIMCCPPGSFDSKFGSGTENAVKKYQGKKVLPKMALLAMVHGMHW
jgi:peptidoglycan hydrolase-like protein with peptidoglycan-binding domain